MVSKMAIFRYIVKGKFPDSIQRNGKRYGYSNSIRFKVMTFAHGLFLLFLFIF